MDNVLIAAGVVNAISFAAFGIDKFLAIHKRRRISERRLLQLAMIGGSIGAIAGQQTFRHKTQKFKRILWIIVLVHGMLFGFYYKVIFNSAIIAFLEPIGSSKNAFFISSSSRAISSTSSASYML